MPKRRNTRACAAGRSRRVSKARSEAESNNCFLSIANGNFLRSEPGNAQRYRVALFENGRRSPAVEEQSFALEIRLVPDGTKGFGHPDASTRAKKKKASVLAN